jgi:hypothetical protein
MNGNTDSETEDGENTTAGSESGAGSILGGFGGIFAIYEFNENIGFEVNILYSMEGGEEEDLKQDFEFGDIVSLNRFNQRVYFHNLEFPLIARVGLKNLKILLGGAYGFNMAAWEVQDKSYQMKDDTYFHYKNQYENVWSQYQQHQIAAIRSSLFYQD